MSSASSTIGIKLSLDGASQVQAGVRSVTGSLDGMGRAVASVRGLVAGLAGTFAGVVSAQQFLRSADAVTQLKNSLQLASGSAELATQAYGRLFEIAQRSRVSFVELGGTFASISRAGESLNLSQANLLDLTETIGNAVTISGAGAQAAQAALMQLSQGLASGVLRGEELNSVMEQTPRLARALADGLGVSIGQLRELGKEGQLSAERVISALLSQSNVLAGEVRESILTVGQAMTQLQNASTALVGEIDRTTGASAQLAATVSGAAVTLSDIARAFQQAESAGKPFAAFGDAIATVFETVTVLGVNVAYVLKGIGNELGGLAAQAVSVAKLDFSGAAAIGQMMREDAAKARADVDALSSRILNSRKLSQIADSGEGLDEPRFRRLLQPTASPVDLLDSQLGANKKGRGRGAVDKNKITAADVLAVDMADIERTLGQYTSAYKNAQDVVSAAQAAGLVSDREYYEAQLGFINLNSEARLSGLQRERDRLEQEKLTGAERLQQLQRIADIEAEMGVVRQDAATQTEVLNIQEGARLKKLVDGYNEAKLAAQAYLDTLQLQYARELDGVGKGDKARRLASGLNQIDDRYESQRQGLAGERRRGEITEEDYRRQLALIDNYNAMALDAYRQHYADLDAAQGNWLNGANDAFANYRDNAANIAGQTSELFTSAFQGMEDALVTFVTTGKLSFTDLANGIVADITRIIIKQQISNALGLAGGAGGSGLLGLVGAGIGSLFGTGGQVAVASAMGGNAMDNLMNLTGGFGTMSFDGGGYTGNGPRVGGIDGKGGFWALMHPQETVVDHTKGQGVGRAIPPLNVTVQMPAGANRQTATQFGHQAGREIQRSLARNG